MSPIDGGACVLGSDFINGLYAVRWLVTSSSHRHYVMFAVLPGRRPRFARFVDLGQQIVQGSSRTDYVSSLMPGVHYSFLVVPLDGKLFVVMMVCLVSIVCDLILCSV